MTARSAERAVELLRQREATVSTAESLTAGMLCAVLVDVPGASDVVRGGIIAYAADLKASLLSVPDDLLARAGTVHADTAVAMARGARAGLGSDYGLATTGVAGPDTVEGKPVGLVFIAIVGPAGADVRRLELPGDRSAVRCGAVAAALSLLCEGLERGKPGGRNGVVY